MAYQAVPTGHGFDSPFAMSRGRREPMWLLKAAHYGVESRPRNNAAARSCVQRVAEQTLGTVYVAGSSCFKPEAMFGCVVATASTLYYWNYAPYLDVNMNWAIVSMGIIFPITSAIGMGFSRREKALALLEKMFSDLRHVYGSLHTWLVKDATGEWRRAVEVLDSPGEPPGAAKEELGRLMDELCTAVIAYVRSLDLAVNCDLLRPACTDDAVWLLWVLLNGSWTQRGGGKRARCGP